jgi:hypothetical protein
MPLHPGSSNKIIGQNIKEFHTGKTYAHTKAKFGTERARAQAIAVALHTAREYGKKYGGRTKRKHFAEGGADDEDESKAWGTPQDQGLTAPEAGYVPATYAPSAKVAKAIGNVVTAPIQEVHDATQPTLPPYGQGRVKGQWDEEDEYNYQRQRDAFLQKQIDTGADLGMQLMGSGTAFGKALGATKGSIGIFGGEGAYAGDEAAQQALQARIAQANELRNSGVPEEKIWQETQTGLDKSGKRIHEISDYGTKLSDQHLVDDPYDEKTAVLPAGKSIPLGEILDHPNLEKAYPGISKDLQVVGGDTSKWNGSELGHYDQANNRIVVYPQSERSMYDTLLHEVNHHVQKLENFDPGANPLQFMTQDDWKLAKNWHTTASALKQETEQTMGVPFETVQTAVSKIATKPATLTNEEATLLRQIASDPWGKKLLYTFINFDKQWQQIHQRTLSQYKNVAGEAASRNVEYRARYTPEEAAGIPPEHSMQMMRSPVHPNDLIQSPMYSARSANIGEVGGIPIPPEPVYPHQAIPPQDKLGFYSKADEIVADGPNKAPAQQWISTLKNRGMKNEEDEFLGISDWLKQQQGPVNKTDLQNYIRRNRIKLREEVATDPHQVLPEEWGGNPVQEWDEEGNLLDPNPQQEFIPHGWDEVPGQTTRWQDYKLPGGENYAERKLYYTPAGTTEFYHPHWEGDPNVLAHIRHDDRVVNGKKTLHINEIQSDWHQRGSQYGYVKPGDEERMMREYDLEPSELTPDAPYKKNWTEFALKRLIKHAAENGYEQISWPGDLESLASTEHWGDITKNGNELYAHPNKKITPVVRRYLSDLPDIANKIGKPNGAAVQQAKYNDGFGDNHRWNLNVLPITQGLKNRAIVKGFSDWKRGGLVTSKADTASRTVRKYGPGGAPSAPGIKPKLNEFSQRSYRASIGHPPGGGMPGVGNIKTPHVGMIHSSIPGRTDKINMGVKGGSYILPADVVSGVGQGNSMAGSAIINKMFSMGPYGSADKALPTPKVDYGRAAQSSLRMPRLNLRGTPGIMAAGGVHEDNHKPVPIIAAGGEMVIPPEVVLRVGHGNLKHGHEILDHMVLHLRKKTIHDLKHLKPPKKK